MKNKTKYILSISLFFADLILFVASILLYDYNEGFLALIIFASILLGVFITTTIITYFNHTEFICRHCNHQFKPNFKTALMAIHSFRYRLLTCPKCNKKSWCKDKFIEDEKTAK